MLVSRFRSDGYGLLTLLAVAGMLFAGGCDPGGYSGPTGTVSGTVTLPNGDPAPQGCTVSFVSDEGHTASGKVGPGGAYELSVIDKGGDKSSGVPVATYKVMVSPPASETSEGDYDAMMEAESEGGGEQAKAEEAPAEEVIPAKYQSAGTSELSFEVKAGANPIDIPLK